MCGILITNKNIQQLLQNLQEYLKTLILRGPDGINHVIINNFLCLHTLLSITKNNTNVIIKQPFVYENGKYIVLYNGEIYNYKEIEKKYTKNYIIDGECIYDLYKEHNYDFIKYLDGEFAIILIDFVKNIIVYSTDIFSTKPLWLSFNKNTKEIGLCSYESILKKIGFENIIQLNPNEINVIDLITFNNIYKNSVYNFDLNQHKENYNDFLLAFQKSVVKRTRIDNLKNNIGICMGLSSGYDSGCLCNELWKQKINFTSYTIYGIENLQILSQRKKLYKQNVVIGVNSDIINKQRIKLEEMEEYNIDIDNGEQEILNKLYGEIEKEKIKYQKKNIDIKFSKTYRLIELYENKIKQNKNKKIKDDNGAIGLSLICELAKTKNQLVFISGTGADEIFSDYGFNGKKYYNHSSIGGYFPSDLKLIFPWKNFYMNTQRAYLMKEEYILGYYGMEGRYPYLDKDVVQEFLWLKNDLKNEYYKAPLYKYLTMYKVPFEINVKIGFNCGYEDIYSNKKIIKKSEKIEK